MTTVLDRFRLDDKVAIVTGASSGLGEVGSVVADHSDVLGHAPHAWCMRSRADRYARRSSARWSSYRLSTAQALTPGAP